ncbi:peptide chain release factor N(5)-glutamine methyltransferase [Jeotgalicoccus huakuii]|nr:peptide chain release factor N(5)-glutamine methyltransferase [Jeotgalicoccus huakuii]
MKRYKEVLKEAEASLSISGQETRIASILLEEMFGLTLSQLMIHENESMPQADYDYFMEVIDRVIKNEPYQYVLGEAYFYDTYFKVTSDTLIPRPETEELVYYVLKNESDHGLQVADIGTGTGAIGLTLARTWKNNKVTVTDISSEALRVAKENGVNLGVEVTYKQGDLLTPLKESRCQFDVLISNPPYVSEDETHLMTQSVLEYEPHQALFADDDGLALYKKMILTLDDVLTKGGRVYFEIGYAQGAPLLEFVKDIKQISNPVIIKDINEQDRILHFTWGEDDD